MWPEKTSVLFTTVAPKPSTVPRDPQEYLLNEERKVLKAITGIFMEITPQIFQKSQKKEVACWR